jgi:hypoxanthine phosphoribosyltransferase
MKQLSFDEIMKKIKSIEFEKLDVVVAIGRGGIVPAAFIANHLNLDIKVVWIEFRDSKQKPKYPAPQLVKPVDFGSEGKKILLVDDVARTGATLRKAKEVLKGEVRTFVINGKADYSLYCSEECFKLPWSS